MHNAAGTHHYAFDSFRFDAAAGELHGPDRALRLRPQVASALELLLSRRGEVVSRSELRAVLWPDTRVVIFEGSIAAVIRELRRALDDDPKAPRYIETVPKRGYRFVAATAPVRRSAARPALPQGTRGGFLRIPAALALTLVGLAAGDSGPYFSGRHAAPVTVAVLPFEDATATAARRLLASMLPAELVRRLGAMAPEHLRVVDRLAAEKAGRGRAPAGRPADFVLLGSVRDEGSAAVISATMLGAADGRFVWGDEYRRAGQDASLTAREVAARVAESVASNSLPQWSNGSAAVPGNAAALDAFRRGTEALGQLSHAGTLRAVDAFREAIALDPGFSAAHAHLALALTSWTGPEVTQERVEQARTAALSALELLPTNAVGHRILGEIALYYDRDWESAGRLLEQSIELAPSDASGHHSYAGWLSARGRHADALREIELAAALDPESVAISIDVMFYHYYARDFDGAISAARRLQQLWPGNAASSRYTILSRLAMGDVAGAAGEARARLAEADSPAPEDSGRRLPDTEALEAYWTASLRMQQQYVEEHAGDPAVLAIANVQLGRIDAASDALESAFASRRFSYYLPYLGVSPALDPLCGHPRFERLLRRLHQTALGGSADPPRCAALIARPARVLSPHQPVHSRSSNEKDSGSGIRKAAN